MPGVKMVCDFTSHKAEIKLRPDMAPTGPLNRVADNSLAKKLLGWEGLRSALSGWLKQDYRLVLCDQRIREEVNRTFGRLLTER